MMRDFLLSHPRAALFASPGLTKTASTLSALNELFLDGVIERALVVAPLRVAQRTWPNEAAKWDTFGWMRVGYRDPKAQVMTLNYERLSELETVEPYDVVVMDELTKCKSPQSSRADHLRKLLVKAPRTRRWGLTGTPRPNSIFELHNQIKMLDDGKRLSPSFHHFQSTYGSPIDYQEYQWVAKPGAERIIYQKISDLVLTLRASDYLDIADMVVEDIEIRLPTEAHSTYKTLERDLVVLLQGGAQAVVARNAAILVNKLLQVCGGTVYDEERGVAEIHSGKINALKRLLADMPDENCLIFTNYIHERERVVRALPGAVDASLVKGDIEKLWNSGGIKYLVADPRSLGHGLNLQEGGRTAIWYSPTWSRELYDQANARIARKGQKSVPQVFRLSCTGTMDDVVYETLRNRGDDQATMMRLLTEWQRLGRSFK